MLKQAEISRVISRITEKISKDHDPEKIILFGSYAKGTSRYDRERVISACVQMARSVEPLIREWSGMMMLGVLVRTAEMNHEEQNYHKDCQNR